MNHKIFSFGLGVLLGTSLYQIVKLLINGQAQQLDYMGIGLVIGGAAIVFYGLRKKGSTT